MNTNRIYLSNNVQIISSRFVRHSPETYKLNTPFFKPSGHFLYYHLKGKRQVERNGSRYSLKEGDVLTFLAGNAYITPIPEAEYEAVNIVFTPHDEDAELPENSIIDNTDKYINIPFIINVKDDIEIKLIFEEIARISVSFHPLRKLRAKYLLKLLLISLATKFEFSQDKLLKPVELIIEMLRSNPERNYKIDELAQRLNLSRSSVTKLFRRATGKSIKSYELEIKINTAINTLQSNPYIKFRELSDMLGFNDEYHFSNTFKRIAGKSPLAYRNDLQTFK